jgi:hypothetical protein
LRLLPVFSLSSQHFELITFWGFVGWMSEQGASKQLIPMQYSNQKQRKTQNTKHKTQEHKNNNKI